MKNCLLIFMMLSTFTFLIIFGSFEVNAENVVPDSLEGGDFVGLRNLSSPFLDWLIEDEKEVHMAMYDEYEYPDYRFIEAGAIPLNVHRCTYEWLNYLWEDHVFYEVNVDRTEEKEVARDLAVDWSNYFPKIHMIWNKKMA